MVSLLDPRLWLALLLAIAVSAGLSYHKGGKDERAAMLADQLKATAQARETEQELQRLNNRWTSSYIDRERRQQEKARALPTITLIDDCTVPAAVGRLLNDAQRPAGAVDAGARSGAGAAGSAADPASGE